MIAHRGDSFFAPENTLLAAGLGHRSGADAWEFDVQLTSDGIPVVIHDSSLRRTTDVATRFEGDPRADLDYQVSEFTLDELSRLDAGAWFVAGAGRPRTASSFGTLERLDREVIDATASGLVRIPTLEDALRTTIDLDWMANVEIKSAHDGDFLLVDTVIDVIRRLGATESVLVSSFDHAEVARVAAADPRIATGVLATTPLFRPWDYVREVVGADSYHLSATALGLGGAGYLRRRTVQSLRISDIAECRERGVPLLVYTVNESEYGKKAGHLAEAGVAGLFTDDPDSIIESFIPSAGHTRRHSRGIERRSASP